jgi:ABC-type polysaccharide/polyol phosphate export permease
MLEDLRELWRYRELLVHLVLRDLRVRYKRSVLGFAWSLANPLLMILVITVMVKFILGVNVKNYSAFIFPIMFAWNFFQLALLDGCSSILVNFSLVKRIYFPREILPLAVIGSNLIHFLVALGLTFVYLIILHVIPGQVTAKVLLLPVIVLVETMLIVGIGLAVSCLNVLYEDIKYIVTVLITVFFYVNPIIYPIEKVPDQFYHWYMLNPMATILVAYQKVLLPPIQLPLEGGGFAPVLPFDWLHGGLALGTSFLVLVGGYWIFNRYKWQLAERM